jgi:CheY-like chemotaxis protein
MDIPILLIGDTNRPEFRAATASLIEHGALSVADLSSALQTVRDGFNPALIVIAESWPGQFSNRELNELRRAAPLARIVGLLGPWLEGEARTGKPWPTMVRVYWHQASARLGRELEAIEDGNSSLWSFPVTASEDEKLLFSGDAVQFDSPPTTIIAICSRHRETAEALSDICASRGWATVWLRNLPADTPLRVSAVLFDVGRGDSAELKTIAKLKAITENAPIVALVGFPRCDDIDRLCSAGASAIVSKPFLTADLLWQVEQLLATAGVR